MLYLLSISENNPPLFFNLTSHIIFVFVATGFHAQAENFH